MELQKIKTLLDAAKQMQSDLQPEELFLAGYAFAKSNEQRSLFEIHE